MFPTNAHLSVEHETGQMNNVWKRKMEWAQTVKAKCLTTLEWENKTT
jgi:hypothetical protein